MIMTTYKQAHGLFERTIDNVHIVLNENNGLCFQLNTIGKFLFDYLKSPKTKQQVIEIMARLYKLDETQCEVKVHIYLNMLLDRELIEAT